MTDQDARLISRLREIYPDAVSIRIQRQTLWTADSRSMRRLGTEAWVGMPNGHVSIHRANADEHLIELAELS